MGCARYSLGLASDAKMPDMIETPGKFQRLRHVMLNEAEPRVGRQMRQIAPRAGDQIIQAQHAVAVRQQAFAQVGTDEAGGPRNQMFHALDLNVSGNVHATFGKVPVFSPLEITVFLVLLIASVCAFGLRFGRVVRKIREAKPDADFKLGSLGKRAWDFISEVLLQSKVIRERPLPGLAHAFVFWGFCAFALITLNHFATGVGLAFLSRDGWFGRFYFDFAAAFAVAVAISIAGLFVRRFFVRPRWLGENVSIESGVIAFLIFVLMITYLAAFWYGDSKPLWWAHTLALLVFLPLIPHTKHLHLVLSPLTVFLSRGEFAHIPPLAGDDDFGLDTGKDLTRIVALQAYSCVECGRCTRTLPRRKHRQSSRPQENRARRSRTI